MTGKRHSDIWPDIDRPGEWLKMLGSFAAVVGLLWRMRRDD